MDAIALSMCRICLAADMPMRTIINTNLEVMYERLTFKPFKAKDRPLDICYICCAKLRNCLQLQIECLQSEKMFTQMLQNNMLKLPQATNRIKRVHPFINISFVPEEPNSINSIKCDDIKTEPVEVMDDVQLKEEYTEDMEYNTEENPCMMANDLLELLKNDDNCTHDVDSFKYNIQAIKSEDTIASGTSANCIDDKRQMKYTSQTPELKNTPSLRSERMSSGSYLSDHSTFYHETESNQNSLLKNAKVILHRLDFGDPKTNPSTLKTPILTGMKEYLQSGSSRKLKTNGTRKRKKKMQNIDKSNAKRKKKDKNSDLYKCNICEKEFTFKNNLHRHIEIHNNVRRYKCDICEKSYYRNHHLTQHKRVHTGEKPYKCALCDISFTRKYYLNQHNQLHNNKRRFICDVCEKCFNRKGNLRDHIRVHTGERPYKCNFCKRPFSHKQSLMSHIFIEHEKRRK